MSEPPLTDRELRILRGLIDDHETARAVDAWFAFRWRFIAGALTVLGGIALLFTAIVEAIHYL